MAGGSVAGGSVGTAGGSVAGGSVGIAGGSVETEGGSVTDGTSGTMGSSVAATGGDAAGCSVSSGMLDSVASMGAFTWGFADSAVTSGTVGIEIGSCTIAGAVTSGCFLLWAAHDAVDKLTVSTSSTANSWFLWFVFIAFLPFCSLFCIVNIPLDSGNSYIA